MAVFQRLHDESFQFRIHGNPHPLKLRIPSSGLRLRVRFSRIVYSFDLVDPDLVTDRGGAPSETSPDITERVPFVAQYVNLVTLFPGELMFRLILFFINRFGKYEIILLLFGFKCESTFINSNRKKEQIMLQVKDDTTPKTGKEVEKTLTQYGLVPEYLLWIGGQFYEFIKTGDLIIDGDPDVLLKALQSGTVSYTVSNFFDPDGLIKGIRLDIEQRGSIILKGEAAKEFFLYHINLFETIAADDTKS